MVPAIHIFLCTGGLYYNRSFLGGELGLDLVYFLVGDLECLGEHAVGQLTGSLEEHHGDGLCAGKLAVEDRDDSGGFGTHMCF